MNSLLKNIGVIAAGSLLMMACEHPTRMNTKVYEDGKLNKVIELEKSDSIEIYQNVFNISENKGWKTEFKKLAENDSSTGSDEYHIRFEKSFASDEEFNRDLNSGSDSLFNIKAKFEKSFRWFYTYMRYSESFQKIDRLKKVNSNDYFNQEDNQFLDRLPGNGGVISKADSVFLNHLNERIFDNYAAEGLFLEEYDILMELIDRNADKKWKDTVARYTSDIFERFKKNMSETNFSQSVLDSLRIPYDATKLNKDLIELSKAYNSRKSFMGYAQDGKYNISMEMPWNVVSSNADSVAGNTLYWRPIPTKFAIKDYEMYAEARKLNWWAVIASLIIVGTTAYILIKK